MFLREKALTDIISYSSQYFSKLFCQNVTLIHFEKININLVKNIVFLLLAGIFLCFAFWNFKNMDLIPFASGRQSSLNLLLFSKFLFLLFAKYYRRSWKTSLFSFFQIFNLVWCMPLSLAKGHSKSTSLAEGGGDYPKGWHLLFLYCLKTISLLSFWVTWGEGVKKLTLCEWHTLWMTPNWPVSSAYKTSDEK